MRTSGSLWEHLRAPRVPYAALTRNLAADVLIVGGGITGAMIAEMLTEAGSTPSSWTAAARPSPARRWYGGNGITYSRIAAEVLRTALTGARDPDADL